MEVGVTHDMFLPFQGQTYDGQTYTGQTYGGQPSTAHAGTGMLSPPPPFPPPAPLPPPAPPPPPALPKPAQGGFRKVCRTEEAGPCPFPGLAAGVLEMRVKEGSKIRNLMGFALARVQGEGGQVGEAGRDGGGGQRQIVFTGSGRAVTKTITCAEIMKRKVPGLHQVTKLHHKGVQEVWESLEDGASDMTVHRTVPSISILLSKDPLDPQEPGYQPPADSTALWDTLSQEEKGPELSQAAGKRSFSPSAHPSQPASKRPCLMDGSFHHLC